MTSPVAFAVAIAALGCAAPFAEAASAIVQWAQATPETATQPLSGAAAWAAMLGNTITGTTPDGEFSEYFNPDGSFVHLDRDGRAPGRWMLKDALVCFVYPDDDEVECRKPELTGRTGAFSDTDGVRYPFELLPGNPKNL